MGFDKETFRRLFPHLAKELESSENEVAVSSVRTETGTAEKAVSRGFVRYDPDMVDFIRRCDTEQQAEELIAYMEERGEIDNKCGSSLRNQLGKKGVRSFGLMKEENYYLKHGEP